MMKDKKKIAQPFRNPNEYSCYLEGAKAAAEALGYKVDSLAWGGGIPDDLTLYTLEDKPEPVVTVEIDEDRNTVVYHTEDDDAEGRGRDAEPVVAVEILEYTAETSRRVEVVPEAGEQLRVVKDDAEPDAGT